MHSIPPASPVFPLTILLVGPMLIAGVAHRRRSWRSWGWASLAIPVVPAVILAGLVFTFRARGVDVPAALTGAGIAGGVAVIIALVSYQIGMRSQGGTQVGLALLVAVITALSAPFAGLVVASYVSCPPGGAYECPV